MDTQKLKKVLIGVGTFAVGFMVGMWAYNKFLKGQGAMRSVPQGGGEAEPSAETSNGGGEE